MSRFYGTVTGSGKTEAARRGTEKSKLKVRCNGWNAGVTISADLDLDSKDIFYIYSNGGSNERTISYLIGFVDYEGIFHKKEE